MKESVCIICGDKSPIISKRGRKRKKESVCERKLEMMLGYLLDNKTGKFVDLKTNILKLKEGKAVGFCSKCELEAEAILELHLELEKVQMRMIDKLECVKKLILHLDLEEERSTKDIDRTIKDFQNAIKQNDKESVRIPLVFLERHSFIRKENTTYLLLENEVKTEPEPSSNWDSPPTPDFEDEDVDSIDQRSNADVFEATEVKPSGHVTEGVLPADIKRGRGRPRNLKRKGKPDVHRLLKCETCQFQTKKRLRFEEHLRSHETQDRPHKCGKCDEKFTTKQYLNFHHNLHKKKYRCEVCSEQYNAFEEHAHLKTHIDVILPCPKCHRCYATPERYFAHLKWNHEGQDLACHICLLPMQSKMALLELMEHLHQVHNVGEELKCDFEGCGKAFILRDTLLKHKILHTDLYTCKICLKRCSNLQCLKKHEMGHSALKPFKCDQCVAEFLFQEALDNHIRIRHEGLRIQCEECGKEFYSKEGHRYHIRVEHGAGTRCICKICGQRFGSSIMLQKHMDVAHSTERKYVCEECGKAFRAKIHYWTHKRTHGEKTHKCSYCPSAFTKRSYLIDHERTHLDARPFVCSLCGMGYKQLSTLIVHKRKCGKASSS